MDFVQHYITECSILLQPYREIVGQTASTLSILQVLSPIFMFNEMRKTKSTNNVPFPIFLLILVLTSLSIRFSQLLNDGAMFNANLVGFVLSCVYVSIFYHYVPPQEKSDHLLKIFGAAAFISLVIVYSKLEDPAKVGTRFGFILSSIMYCMFALPVLGIYEALTKKCTRHIPLAMVVTGTIVGFAWFVHGVAINSGFIIGQNLVMLLINLFQLSLFLKYPSEPSAETEKADGTKKKAE